MDQAVHEWWTINCSIIYVVQDHITLDMTQQKQAVI